MSTPTPETPAKAEENKSSAAPGPEQKTYDATVDAPKDAAPAKSTAPAPKAGNDDESQAFKDDLVDGQRAIPKRSFDATSANAAK